VQFAPGSQDNVPTFLKTISLYSLHPYRILNILKNFKHFQEFHSFTFLHAQTCKFAKAIALKFKI